MAWRIGVAFAFGMLLAGSCNPPPTQPEPDPDPPCQHACAWFLFGHRQMLLKIWQEGLLTESQVDSIVVVDNLLPE